MADSPSRGVKLDLVFLDEIADIPDPSEVIVPVVYGEVVFGRGTCIANYTEPVTKELVEYAAALSIPSGD